MPSLEKFSKLIDIMARLRDPNHGCPWDLDQDFASIAPFTVEEAYEVADAIARNNLDDLKDELGDLALQVVFHAQIATEQNAFTLEEVFDGINAKMIRRHPHIFSDATLETAQDVKQSWDAIKEQERAQKSTKGTHEPNKTSALDGVALALPALMRAQKLAKRAARTGFDWTNPADIFDKLTEETQELQAAINNNDPENMEEEIGDLLFVVTNLARRLDVDAETALTKANAKFTRRFHAMETLAETDGVAFSALSLDEQEALWQKSKASERA